LNSKTFTFFGAGALVLLAALYFPVLFLRQNPLRNLLLVSPAEDSSYVFDLQKLGRIAEDEFLLTYEIRQQLAVRTAYGEYPVTLIGTNSLYPALSSYPMLRGSFFTGTAEKGKNREAVLNETAAFRLFGGDNIAGRILTIEGAPWLVTGIMDDGEEAPRVYVPAAVKGEGPRALLALLNGAGGVDPVYVKNALMPLGIHETSHLFFDLSGVLRLCEERFALALRFFICALFCIIARRQSVFLKALVLRFKARLKQEYIGELIRKGRWKKTGTVLRFSLSVLGLSGGALFCLTLLLQNLRICLGWRDMPSPALILGKGDFPALWAALWNCYYPDTLLFALCLTFTALMPLFGCPPPVLFRIRGAESRKRDSRDALADPKKMESPGNTGADRHAPPGRLH
jgi:hypothetical protein